MDCEDTVFILIHAVGRCNLEVLKMTFLRQNVGNYTNISMS